MILGARVIALALVPVALARDPCAEICALDPDICGTEGSFCMGGEDDECFDLYWTDRTRRSLSNATIKQCPLDHPLRCSDARRYLASRSMTGDTEPSSASPALPLFGLDVAAEAGGGDSSIPDFGDMEEFARMLSDLPPFPGVEHRRPSSRGSKRSSDGSDDDERAGPAKRRAGSVPAISSAAPLVDLSGDETDENRQPATDKETSDDLAAIASLLTLQQKSPEDDFEFIDFEHPAGAARGDGVVSLVPELGPSAVSAAAAADAPPRDSRSVSSLARWRHSTAAHHRPSTPFKLRIDPVYFQQPLSSAAASAHDDDAQDADWAQFIGQYSSDSWDIFAPSRGESVVPSHRRRRVVPLDSLAAAAAEYPVHRRGFPGTRGIRNLGLTCYFGATLQVLSHSSKLRQFLEANPAVNPNPVETQFRAFMGRMWAPENDEGALNPIEAFTAFSATPERQAEFRIGRMSDAHEALAFILDDIATALKPADAPFHSRSNLDTVLAIEDTQRLACSACGGVSATRTPLFEMFLNIPEIPQVAEVADVHEESQVTAIAPAPMGDGFLGMDEALELLGMGPIAQPSMPTDSSTTPARSEQLSESPRMVMRPAADFVTLNECFGTYAQDETIPAYACESCSPDRHDARQVHRITNTSDILIIALRRFTWENNIKIGTPVEIPMMLNMTEVPGSETTDVYQLVGVVNHFGRTRDGGHYTAIVHNSVENRWMRMDDSFTEHAADFGTQPTFRSSEAYILMYERINPIQLGTADEVAEVHIAQAEPEMASSTTSEPTEVITASL